MKQKQDDLKKIFAKNLKNKRKDKNFTQADLAEKIGLSPSFITEIENGRKAPSFSNIEKIASVLETPPWVFFFESEYTFKSEFNSENLFSFELKNAVNNSIDEFLKNKTK